LRALLVADIHANLEALQSVVKDASAGQGFDQIWSLGDVVGYGPDPAACIDLLREHDVTAVAGNHDLAACGVITPEDFNEDAAAAIWWTISQLEFSHYTYLKELSQKLQVGQFTIVHGSAREPFWREYVDTPEAAKASHPAQDEGEGAAPLPLDAAGVRPVGTHPQAPAGSTTLLSSPLSTTVRHPHSACPAPPQSACVDSCIPSPSRLSVRSTHQFFCVAVHDLVRRI